MVASSPIARCRNPPTLALAYISPARSSKRRMSIIASSHSRATSGSGRSPIGANGSDCGLAEAHAGHLAPAGVRAHDPPQRAGAPELCLPSAALPAAPLGEKAVGLELREVGTQRAHE